MRLRTSSLSSSRGIEGGTSIFDKIHAGMKGCRIDSYVQMTTISSRAAKFNEHPFLHCRLCYVSLWLLDYACVFSRWAA